MTKEYQKGNQKFIAMHIEAKKNELTTRKFMHVIPNSSE